MLHFATKNLHKWINIWILERRIGLLRTNIVYFAGPVRAVCIFITFMLIQNALLANQNTIFTILDKVGYNLDLVKDK